MSEAATPTPEAKVTVTFEQPKDWRKDILIATAVCLIVASIPIILTSTQNLTIISTIGLTNAIVTVLLASFILYGIFAQSGEALKITYYAALFLLAVRLGVVIFRIISFVVSRSGSSDSNISNRAGFWSLVLAVILLVFHIFIPLAIKSYMSRAYPGMPLKSLWAFFACCKGDKG